MVYLVHSSGTKFWKCVKTTCNNAKPAVVVSYGKVGTAGRTMAPKEFDDEEAADAHCTKQEAAKRRGGYDDDEDDEDIPATKPAPPPAAAACNHKKRSVQKGGLAGHAAPPPTNSSLDSGVAGLNAALASRASVVPDTAARLALVDPATNTDKYYVLQALVVENAAAAESPPKKPKGRTRTSSRKKKAVADAKEYYLYTRWGRTGTGGQAKLEGPFPSFEDVEAAFDKIFKSKVGIHWNCATAGTAPKKGKYEYLAENKNNDSASAKWFYYLQNDPLGKNEGWYEYDDANGREVEQLYGDYVAAQHQTRLSSRTIHSESSGFVYRIDLAGMHQSNCTSGTRRPIGRITDGSEPQQPQEQQEEPHTPKKVVVAKSSTRATPQTPRKVVVASSRATNTKKPSSLKIPPSATAAATSSTSSPSTIGVDAAVSSTLQNGSVYEDYSATLNQTNINSNNNKFYKIQLIDVPGSGIYLFTKWGRVGEAGTSQELGPLDDADVAVKEFGKKYRSKTGNKWEDRDDFVPKKGKYTLVEMETDEQTAAGAIASANAAANAAAGKAKVEIEDSTLDSLTKGLVDLIFDEDMFHSAMSDMNLDPTKLPLGALSKPQIQKGFAVLVKLEQELDGDGDEETLTDLTSEFYTVIPHAFGRSRGPVLNTKEKVASKFDMLNTLTDIEAAQEMQRRAGNDDDDEETQVQEHPSDLNYQQLCADLTVVDRNDDEFNLIENFFDDTKANRGSGGGGMKLRNVWRCDRHHESERYATHDDLTNRKLLWHGTNVAVVAAILKSGLRIMPHSGGRVGRGIYLADMHQKSEWYVAPAKGTVIMFLVEAALGRECVITQDDGSLTCAPGGFDSVLAMGRNAPPKSAELGIDDRKVGVPCGKPKGVAKAKHSSFDHNEYLIYKESQHRIRYVLTFGA